MEIGEPGNSGRVGPGIVLEHRTADTEASRDVESHRVGVDEHGGSPGIRDGIDRGDVGERGDDDLVARADAERLER